MTTSLRRIALLLASAALIASAGCVNGSPRTSGDEDGSSRTDAMGPDVGTPDSGPDEIVAAVDIALKPPRHVYTTGTAVTGSATVYDKAGDKVSNPSTRWSLQPADAGEKVGSSKFKLQSEGRHKIQACATLQSGQDICGTKVVLVDDGPPTVEILEPKPGAILGGNGDQKITVRGQITDSHGELSAYLSGERLDLHDDGSFQAELEPRFGVNTIRVIASDGVNQRNVESLRQVLWAPNYAQLQTGNSEIGVEFQDGVAFNIGQNYFDDAEPPTRNSADTELITKDFADILTVLASNLNIKDKIPNPVVDSGNARLEVEDIKLGEPDVTVDVADAGLDAFLHIDNLNVQTSGSVTVEGQTLSLTGTVTGRVSAFTSLSVARDSSKEKFTSSVQDVDISLDQISPSFADKEANAVFELADSTLRSKLETTLIDAVRQEVVDTLPELISVQLNWLDKSLSSRSFEFGTDVTGQREVSFQGNVDSFQSRFREGMIGVFQTKLSTSGTDAYPNTPGIPMTTSQSGAPPWFEQSRVQMGLRVAMLNGMLTSLWRTGYLNLDLTSVLPDNLTKLVKEAKLEGKLPPVLRPAHKTEKYDLIIDVGQLVLDVKALQNDDTYGLRLRAGVNVTIQNNRLKLSIPDEPLIEAWVIRASEDDAFMAPDDLKRLIISRFWPTIKKSISSGLSIYMPAPRIGDLARFAPTLQNMTLEYDLARPISVRNGYIMFDSVLKGTLPLGN